MIVGLDYDGTYTNAPAEFLQLTKSLRAAGHKVYVVTMRYPSEAESIDPVLKENVDGIFATSRQAKLPFMLSQHITVNVWIDDNPNAIYMSAAEIWGTPSAEGEVIDPIYD
jgi:hypothetical protein